MRYENIPELSRLKERTPFLWLNPRRRPAAEALAALPLKREDVLDAEARLRRFAPLLAELFPELREAGGIIESPLVPAPRLQQMLSERFGTGIPGRLWVKADHALPVAGSVKARGGIYEVLCVAERLALDEGLAAEGDSYAVLLSPAAQRLFSEHTVTVASTGNLGLAVGVTGSALGFRVRVHMSHQAKAWKKERLRRRGVEVVEHGEDVTAAGRAAREEAAGDVRIHFVDDENSRLLFLGYSVAALRLKAQFEAAGVAVDERHPLLTYLPCGLGGAPCGIAFGLKCVFGDAARCFIAEPVDAPCVTLGMLAGFEPRPSVYDVGLTNRTEADGLAVATPSGLIGPFAEALLSGCFTVEDDDLFRFLYILDCTEGMHIEPSAAAGFAGPVMLARERKGSLTDALADASHVLWTTGGLFVPAEEYDTFRERGRALYGT
jgi:D-serine dehydratase